jgi:hypothetical protein
MYETLQNEHTNIYIHNSYGRDGFEGERIGAITQACTSNSILLKKNYKQKNTYYTIDYYRYVQVCNQDLTVRNFHLRRILHISYTYCMISQTNIYFFVF